MKALLFVSGVQVLGYVVLLIGLALRYWLNRRKFNRTIGYNLEGFRNYEHKTAARASEWVLKWAAWTFIVLGAFLVAIEAFNHYSAEKYRMQKDNSLHMRP